MYHTVAGTSTGEYEEKKSRFIARIVPVTSEDQATAFIDQVRADNPLARHNVYAYILRAGNRVRYSDDGEPQKTAGVPTLTVLQHADLFDVACVVARYFGGTLLGTGGLVRAYTTATQRAVQNARILVYARCRDIQIVVEYPDFEPLSHWLGQWSVPIVGTEYADVVTLTIRTRSSETNALVSAIDDFCQGRALIEPGVEGFMALPDESKNR